MMKGGITMLEWVKPNYEVIDVDFGISLFSQCYTRHCGAPVNSPNESNCIRGGQMANEE